MKKKNNNNCMKQVPMVHIVYLCILFLIVIVLGILIIPNKISDNALENVTFAATITSIALALVSIISSMRTSSASEESIRRMQDVEKNTKTMLNQIPKIVKNSVNKGMGQITTGIQDIKDEQKKQREILFNSSKEGMTLDNSFVPNTKPREDNTI